MTVESLKSSKASHSQLSTINHQLSECLLPSICCGSKIWRWSKNSNGRSARICRSNRRNGAGKSIIIGALQLLLGDRADKSLIRTGAETCTVEGIFAGRDLKRLNPRLAEAGVEQIEDDLIIKRTLSAAGTNRQFINGSPTTLSILKDLGDELVDLHGPHDHQSLLSPEKQLELLDSFARCGEQLDQYQRYFVNCKL